MMNLQTICDRLQEKGFRKGVSIRPTDEGLSIIDFTHRKRMDMYSAYITPNGSVEFLEYTKIKWDNEIKRNVPFVTKYYKLNEFLRSI